ncbi:MAG: lantibiotic dehydratase, partial [Alphaproteobacteria bacterium]
PGRVPLGAGWTVWRTLCVRGTGFPVAMLDMIAAPESLEAIDRLIAQERNFESLRSDMEKRCRAMTRERPDIPRAPIRRALRRLSGGRVPEPMPELADIEPLRAQLAIGREHLDRARAEAEQALRTANARISRVLREVGGDRRFREALAWQNRRALHDGVDVLLRSSPDVRNSKILGHEEMVTLYLQRYCGKNDSIGFFGPVGWAKFADDGAPIALTPGPGLVAHREVFFEYRTIDRLAAKLAQDREVKSWLPVRLSPLVRLEGNVLHTANGQKLALSQPMADLIAACDGAHPARDIAARLAAGGAGWSSERKVYEALAALERRKIVFWNAEVPIAPRPERWLEATIEGIGDPKLRARARAPLDEILNARARLAAAAGDDGAVARAMTDLERRFTSLTGERPTQHEGQVYGGRTLVYEDCRRDIDLTLGPAVTERLASALTPVLVAARWYTWDMGRRFLQVVEGRYDALARGRPERMEFRPLYDAVFRSGGIIYPSFGELLADFEDRWHKVIGWDGKAARVDIGPQDALQRVQREFAAPRPGWPGARQQSPDVMIAADGIEAIRRGDFFFVLGELHAGSNNLLQTPLFLTYPDPDEFAALHAADMEIPRVAPVNHRSYQTGQRTAPFSPVARDLQLACNDARESVPADRVLRLADLTVARTERGLIVRHEPSGREFHAIQLFEPQLRGWSARNFSILREPVHGPRVTIGDLVVRRESWRFPCDELAFARAKDEIERMIALHRWRKAHALPVHVFARFPQENKPVYVDFASPPSCRAFCRLVRGAAVAPEKPGMRMGPRTVTVSEMLPSPDQTWLIDREGNRYASELRMVAVDPEPWRPG